MNLNPFSITHHFCCVNFYLNVFKSHDNAICVSCNDRYLFLTFLYDWMVKSNSRIVVCLNFFFIKDKLRTVPAKKVQYVSKCICTFAPLSQKGVLKEQEQLK